MASIGGITCTFLRGFVPSMKQESAISRRPGIDGYEIQLLGRGDSQGRIVAVLYSSNAGCNAWAASIQALQGQVAAITNDHGDTGSAYVHHVAQPEKRAAYRPGTTITQRMEIQIQTLTVS